MVTRPRHQASRLSDRLREEGATTIAVPTIDIVDPTDGGAALQRAVDDLDAYDWVVVTSANGAERLCARLPSGRSPAACRVAAIGPGTADVLRDHGLTVDLVPERQIAESLLESFPSPPPDGRVLLARAAVGRDVLPDGLREMGWRVDVVEAYRTVPVVPRPADRDRVVAADIVTFTSASTVENWVTAFGADGVPPIVACIGPVTADAARRLGVRVDLVAPVHTIDGLVDAIVERMRIPDTDPAPGRRGRRFGRRQRRA